MNLLGIKHVANLIVREQLDLFYRKDESACVDELLKQVEITRAQNEQIQEAAKKLIESLRMDKSQHEGIDGLMAEYSLSSEEGTALMCLAESLLRIPDKH